MKKILLIILFTVSFILAQEKTETQSIELPDFVITGKENISIPKMRKSMPDLIPLLSNDFFTPPPPSKEEATINIPKLENETINLGSYHQLTNAIIKLGLGLHTWPKGEFYYNNWSDNLTYKAHLFGLNETEYVKNAGVNTAGISLGSGYYINNQSDFLPGLEISLDGKYYYESYNFFGSSNPSLNRKTNNGNANLLFNYVTNPYFNFGLQFSDLFYEQKDDDAGENVFGTKVYLKFKLINFDLRIDGNYQNQIITGTKFNVGNQYYYNTSATLGINLFNFFHIRGGIYFAESEGNTFFSPIGFGSFKLNKNVSVFGEFSPSTEFLTFYNFKEFNKYYELNDFVNLFVENKFNIKAGIKYEYEKYFEISGGLGYLNSDNNFYFDDKINNGFFRIYKDDIENSYVFVNLLFRKGPFGEFYATGKIQNIIGSNGKNIPYQSTVLTNVNYSYNWRSGFGIHLGLDYYNKSYADYENSITIPSMVDLSASFYYEFFENLKLTLKFENLLNDEYYYFRNYKAKPLDLIFGAEFRW